MAIITAQQIADICKCPVTNLSNFIPFLDESFIRFGIKTPQSVGAFVSNLAVESANFKRTLEYASGEEYEGRADLGSLRAGDGKLFKGRGLIQITGRNNYKAVSRALYNNDCLLITPSLLEAPQPALLSACWYWHDRGLNEISNLPESWIKEGVHGYSKFQWICVRINGGLNNYNERVSNYERAKKILNFGQE